MCFSLPCGATAHHAAIIPCRSNQSVTSTRVADWIRIGRRRLAAQTSTHGASCSNCKLMLLNRLIDLVTSLGTKQRQILIYLCSIHWLLWASAGSKRSSAAGPVLAVDNVLKCAHARGSCVVDRRQRRLPLAGHWCEHQWRRDAPVAGRHWWRESWNSEVSQVFI
jgi:hypothetical protein